MCLSPVEIKWVNVPEEEWYYGHGPRGREMCLCTWKLFEEANNKAIMYASSRCKANKQIARERMAETGASELRGER